MSSQDKMLALLDAFSAEAPVWSGEALIERSGLPPSTGHRYLKSLHRSGLLARVGSGSYVVGPRVLALDRISRLTDPVYSVGSPVVQALSQRTGFSALLSVLDSGSVMCVQQVATSDAPAGLLGRGEQRPLIAGASANVILAHLPAHQLRSLFNRQRDGEVLGSIALATSARSHHLRVFRDCTPLLQDAAAEISRRIGRGANVVDLPARAAG